MVRLVAGVNALFIGGCNSPLPVRCPAAGEAVCGAGAGSVYVPELVAQGGHVGPLFDMAFDPQGALLVSVGADGKIRIWNAQDGTLRAVLSGHTMAVHDLVFEGEGRAVLAAGLDGTIRRFELESGTVQGMTVGPGGGATLALSPDGKTLVGAGRVAGAIHIWDVATMTVIRTLVHGRGVWAAAFLLDGERLLTAGIGGDVRVWNVETGSLERMFQVTGRHPVERRSPFDSIEASFVPVVVDLALDPGGSQLAVLGAKLMPMHFELFPDRESSLTLWSVEEGRLLDSADVGLGLDIAFSPRGDAVVVGGEEGLSAWDVRDGTLRPRWATGTSGRASRVAVFSPDGSLVASGHQDGLIRLRRADDGTEIRTLGGERRWPVEELGFAGHGASIVVFQAGGLWFLNTASGSALPYDWPFGGPAFVDVSIPSESNEVLAASGGFFVESWSAATGALVGAPLMDRTGFRSIVSSADGKTIVAKRGAGFAVFDLGSGAAFVQARPDGADLTAFAVSADGRFVACADAASSVEVWEVDARTLRTGMHDACVDPLLSEIVIGGAEERAAADGAITSLAVSPDGRWVATGDDARRLKLWDASDGSCRAAFLADSQIVTSVAFSPDGRTLASTGGDDTVKLWDVETAQPQAVLATHVGGASSVAWSPDGTVVAAGGVDGVALVRLEDEALLHVDLYEDGGSHRTVAYTPEGVWDGDDLAAASKRMMFRIGSDLRYADMLTADRLGNGFYHPGLLPDFLAGRDVGLPPELRRGVGLPPKVRFVQLPVHPVDRADALVCVAVDEQEGGGVGEVRLYAARAAEGAPTEGREGRPAARVPGDTGGASCNDSNEYLFRVPLVHGTNKLTLQAVNVAGGVRSEEAIKYVECTAPERPPKLYVVTLSVKTNAAGPTDLRYPNDDATALAEAFRRQEGAGLYEQVVVRQFMDDEVRLENLDAAMTEVAAAAETWDVVVLYLSGHAKMVAVPGSPVEEWRYLTFPVHMEADDDDIARLGVSATQLVEMADRVKAQRFVVLLDTCYAGAAVDAVQALRDLRPLSADEGFVVFAGTASDTKSFEDPQIERGYFTAGLIEAINGSSQADLDGNGVVHVLGEFDSSVTGRTIRLSRQCLDAGGHEDIASQTPKFFPPRNPFPFLAVPPGEPPPPFACNER